MNRKKFKKQRLNECSSEDVASGVLLILGAICLALSVVCQNGFMCVIGAVLIACGVPLLLYVINYRVWWDLDGITVQNIFRKSKSYPYKDLSHYYVTLSKTVIVLKNGKKLRFRDSHTDLTELERLQNEMKKHLIGEVELEICECPLYWGNCSRPIQLTLFLLLLGVAAFLSGCIAWSAGVPEKEDRLAYRLIKVVSAEVDPETKELCLQDTDGSVYRISFNQLIDGVDRWVGEEFKIGYDEDFQEIYTLQRRFDSEYVFDLKEYNAQRLRANSGYVILFTFFPVFYLVFLTFVLLAYRFPDRFSRLYTKIEIMHFWSRHW